MTREQIIARFPQASEAFIVANLDCCGLRAAKPKRSEGVPLERAGKRKEKGRAVPEGRFKITFIVYAVRPLDWDNYRFKELQDCCIVGGLIPSDAWRSLEGTVISRKARSAKEERTEIVIEQL